MNEVYLGLGSNLGDKVKNLKKAIKLIGDFSKTEVIQVSKLYETEPWGYKEQDNFFNLCLKVKTDLAPYVFLKECQRVEEVLKRDRKVRWGPRTLDIDILIYEGISLDDENLTLPHPRIEERDFVLWPLLDLNEKLLIKGNTVKQWAKEVGSEGIVSSFELREI
ncbi:2-amino-4-hydroxy-6-hydroxymethyldihydropteridine diphosphokinase [Halonatronum saccharophilum]|uniref:2-amino-4-hydroxy-6- hydroxymethyldihydropteridine diphosphokinase n=1 Tax=Halonatronum saccharophilum TaxID=150060 RepID=UPI0004B64449|nr:2-amino-4-hydroxy-6-hydroxymethyldihydropteridine diphosphokinase [Halonatronum saccharophilum]